MQEYCQPEKTIWGEKIPRSIIIINLTWGQSLILFDLASAMNKIILHKIVQ